jgi:hypothetical protein
MYLEFLPYQDGHIIIYIAVLVLRIQHLLCLVVFGSVKSIIVTADAASEEAAKWGKSHNSLSSASITRPFPVPKTPET